MMDFSLSHLHGTLIIYCSFNTSDNLLNIPLYLHSSFSQLQNKFLQCQNSILPNSIQYWIFNKAQLLFSQLMFVTQMTSLNLIFVQVKNQMTEWL